MKKKIGILLLSVTVLIAVGVSAFFLVTKGRLYREDGLTKNSRCYIENVRVYNDTVLYTVVNNTCRRVSTGEKPLVEKKVGDTWEEFPLWQSQNQRARIIKPFSRCELMFAIDTWVWELEGQYRLRFAGAFDVVGYVEITKAMQKGMTDHGIYREDGVLQTRLVQTKDAQLSSDTLSFTAVNLLDRSVTFSTMVLLQKKEDSVWKSLAILQTDGFTVAANSERAQEIALADPIPSPGEYRILYLVARGSVWWPTERSPKTGEEILSLDIPNAAFSVCRFTVS